MKAQKGDAHWMQINATVHKHMRECNKEISEYRACIRGKIEHFTNTYYYMVDGEDLTIDVWEKRFEGLVSDLKEAHKMHYNLHKCGRAFRAKHIQGYKKNKLRRVHY